MDRRSWPWRKKNSDKVAAGTDSNAASLANTNGQHEDLDSSKKQDSSKNINYVQISLEAYAKLTESEEQVRILNEKLSSALADVTTKDELAKQHAKVAEEAVSGWEKAEAEALALKQQLESLTLLKHESDDRASHLDGALKECMRQIRHIKEESEQKMQELVISKSKQWEKVKFEFEAKIAQLEEELLRFSAENDALARSLQERAAVIMNLKEEKSQADTEIEVLKSNIQSCEREIGSMKYELHVVAKELEIRNEEKNMSIRSAEVVNRQHLESVKKIAKLEAECQRLRGLVRKKLPGPAALAQMKLEVENLGRDHAENRLRRSQGRNLISHPPPVSEFLPDIAQQNQKETEFLTERLLAMEEETKMLKEALAKRNSELQASRNMCAKTASKLHAVEAQLQSLGHGRSLPKSNMEVPVDGSVDHNSSNPPSMTSMSEDGIDDEASCAESWATALISELSNFKKEKVTDKSSKVDISTNLEVMDDFLEMEKLACMSTESNGAISMPNNSSHTKTIENGSESFLSAAKNETCIMSSSGNPASLSEGASNLELTSDSTKASLPQLKKRLAIIFESHAKEADVGSILEDIRCVVQDVQNALPHASVCSSGEQLSETASNQRPHAVSRPMDWGDSAVPCLGPDQSSGIDLTNAISKIQYFVSSLAQEAKNMWKDQNSADELSLSKMELFSESVDKVLCGKMSVQEFILDLARVLSEASELYFNVLKSPVPIEETNGGISADNPNGLDSKVPNHSSKAVFSNGTSCGSNSDFGGLQKGMQCPASDIKETYNCLNEEIAQLKLEKVNVEAELASCKESLEQTKAQLAETEKQLSEIKLQLAASEKSNSLAETQLKCMAESYKLLEVRVSEVETELNQVKAKAEKLDLELQAEQHSHQEAVAKCKDLQEQLQRNEECSRCSSSSTADSELKAKQEKEIAAAAEKLAQCQETIFLLGRQLKALRPAENPGSPIIDKRLENGLFFEDENEAPEHGMHGTPERRPANMDLQVALVPNGDSSIDAYNAALSSSDTESSPVTSSPISSKRQKHRSSKSSSSSASSFSTPEKQGRGISRFFSRGKTSL